MRRGLKQLQTIELAEASVVSKKDSPDAKGIETKVVQVAEIHDYGLRKKDSPDAKGIETTYWRSVASAVGSSACKKDSPDAKGIETRRWPMTRITSLHSKKDDPDAKGMEILSYGATPHADAASISLSSRQADSELRRLASADL